MWTLDELVERVREALAAEYPGAPNGRVRDVPDRRAIRWYTTIGLVDRPLGMRGRTALYGPRHLQQLVAIKRWQAQGRSLSQIQADFVFLTPRDLTEASRVPQHLLGDDAPAAVPDEVVRPRFWADTPAKGETTTQGETSPHGTETTATVAAAGPAAAAGHGVTASDSAVHAAAAGHGVTPAAAAGHGVTATAAAGHTAAPATAGHTAAPAAAAGHTAAPAAAAGHTAAPAAAAVHGVTLGGGAILLLPRPVTDTGRAEIAAAAAPLMSLLESRGLIDGRTP
ncbi:MerR family transcriptional regulator [Actinoplanes sp. KI2]|uniref:MerR family transcriptional regulator n=1 Tax=Actinoplanes sp. KI2 TaxID=2983315 RepID=UPI00294FFA78|nr:MerR family transcriptional regulator [Actinoplanes sp. KI2]